MAPSHRRSQARGTGSRKGLPVSSQLAATARNLTPHSTACSPSSGASGNLTKGRRSYVDNTQNGSLSFLGCYSHLHVVSPISKGKNFLWGEGENVRKGHNSQVSEFSRISIRLVFGS